MDGFYRNDASGEKFFSAYDVSLRRIDPNGYRIFTDLLKNFIQLLENLQSDIKKKQQAAFLTAHLSQPENLDCQYLQTLVNALSFVINDIKYVDYAQHLEILKYLQDVLRGSSSEDKKTQLNVMLKNLTRQEFSYVLSVILSLGMTAFIIGACVVSSIPILGGISLGIGCLIALCLAIIYKVAPTESSLPWNCCKDYSKVIENLNQIETEMAKPGVAACIRTTDNIRFFPVVEEANLLVKPPVLVA